MAPFVALLVLVLLHSAAAAGDLAASLAQLAALRRAGDLDDSEFRAAKARLLAPPPPAPPPPPSFPVPSPAEAFNISALRGGKALIIGGHPDDASQFNGGLAHLLMQQGTEVGFATATMGDASGGCYNRATNASLPTEDCTAQLVSSIRFDEFRDAAAVFGIKKSNVFELGFHDTQLQFEPRARVGLKLAGLLRRFQPDAVFAHHPDPDWHAIPQAIYSDASFHPDHQAIGRAVRDVFTAVSLDKVWPEMGLGPGADRPWRGFELYFWAWTPYTGDLVGITHYVNITGAPLEAKIRALQQHRSQGCLRPAVRSQPLESRAVFDSLVTSYS